MHHRLDVEPFKFCNIPFVEKTLDHEDSLCPARRSRSLRFPHFNQRQTVGLRKASDGVFQPVSVGIGLDDRPKRTSLRRLPHAGDVVLQCLEVNQYGNWSWHLLLDVFSEASEASRFALYQSFLVADNVARNSKLKSYSNGTESETAEVRIAELCNTTRPWADKSRKSSISGTPITGQRQKSQFFLLPLSQAQC